MKRPKVTSLYEAFFSGGARKQHTAVKLGLREQGYPQSALAINDEVFRENTLQLMHENSCYRQLTAADIAVTSLGRKAKGEVDYTPFTDDEMALFRRSTQDAQVIMSVKEQPLRLVTQAEELDIPVIVELHRSDPEHQGQSLNDLWLAIAMGRVAGLVATSESAKEAYAAIGIPEEMIHTIKNGIDLGRFIPSPERRADLRQSLAVNADDPVVAYAARFDPMKDVPLFLDSAREYLGEEETAHILMCGAGMTLDNPQMQQTLRKAFYDAPKLKERVHLLGIRHDMENIYAAADIVSSTSLYGETYPLCLMEGLAAGAVPVATKAGDTPEIVGEGRGILTNRDPRAIAAAWQHAYDNRHEFLAAIRTTRHRFGRDRMIRAYADVVDRYAL